MMASPASANRWPGTVGDGRARHVQDRGARGGQASTAHAVVMPAQQQVGCVRPDCGGRHDRDDRGPGKTAAGVFRLPHAAPVDGVRCRLRLGLRPRPVRLRGVPPGEAGVPEVRGHALRIASPARPGQGLRALVARTIGHDRPDSGPGNRLPGGTFAPGTQPRPWAMIEVKSVRSARRSRATPQGLKVAEAARPHGSAGKGRCELAIEGRLHGHASAAVLWPGR